MKHCNKCNQDKEEALFSKKTCAPDGLNHSCKQCDAVYRKSRAGIDSYASYRQTPKGKAARSKHSRKYRLKSEYGITPEEFEDMALEQDYKCAICGDSNFKDHRLCVDHDHTTGKIRGLLCSSCNRSIGLLKDDINTLKSAIRYLEEAS